MEVVNERLEGVLVLRIEGERMTQEVLDDFRLHVLGLVEGGERSILLEMGRVQYLDSFGVGVIMEIYRRLRALGGSLKLSGLQSRVSRMVSITNLDSVLEIFADEEAAVRSFGG
jgi:anti-sigma B factor antagonist